jgi:hypothetical protein
MQTLFLFINGLYCHPEDKLGWQYHACAWILERKIGLAAPYCYWATAEFEWVRDREHVEDIVEIIRNAKSRGLRIVVVAHSNGCRLICEALQRIQGLTVDEVHLVAAAAKASFRQNWLNWAVRKKRVRNIVVYASPVDGALKLASVSEKLFGWLYWLTGWGYGDLGREGPRFMSKAAKRITRTIWRNYGHGDWLYANFEKTMGMVVEGMKSGEKCNASA